MVLGVNDLIRWLDRSRLAEAELMGSPELALMLDPYRDHPPLPYRCSKRRCREVIAFWALASDGARVVPAPDRRPARQRVAGLHMISTTSPAGPSQPRSRLVGGEADLLYPGLQHSGRFPEYVEWAMRGDSNIRLLTNPDVKAPYPLRFGFACAHCGAHFEHTNRAMLRLFLRAIALCQREIRPTRI